MKLLGIRPVRSSMRLDARNELLARSLHDMATHAEDEPPGRFKTNERTDRRMNSDSRNLATLYFCGEVCDVPVHLQMLERFRRVVV